ELATGVSAILKRTDASRDRIEDLNAVLKIAQSVEVMISQVDTRNRKIQVSIKQMEQQQEREALDSVKKKASEDLAPMTIGDLIKAQLDKKDK
ncbi:MAG: 30S ribosomal protein S1, partial [Pseudomonadales bacterium]|nr:30S ribosomal protein S1 [Pseudomonadales bacterium]